MLTICPSCGGYHADKEVDPTGPYAICPECGHKQRFIRLPLFLVSGASGSGKSAVCLELGSKLKDVVVLEGDVLWRKEFDKPEDDYREFWDVWLRLCVDISQSGRPVVLFASARPAQLEERPARRYFSEIHYLALVCDDEALVERLHGRPKLRDSSKEENIEKHVKWNRWLRENALSTNPPMAVVNTSGVSVQDAANQVAEWVCDRIDYREER